MNNSELMGAKNLNPWERPQKRLEVKQYSELYQLDEMELATLNEFLSGDQVEIYYDLNDEKDYAIHSNYGEKHIVTRVSETPTINGVRWHIVPGKNIIPKPVYEFLMQCPEQARKMSSPTPDRSRNLGEFKSSFSV